MPVEATPKEVVFVLDTSGSMSGMPIEKAKESMKLTLDGLNPNDTFNLITFAGETRILFDKPVPANKENLEKARKLLSGVSSAGGTEMMRAIRVALEPSDASNHIRIVCFMTDGYVGNEAEILSEIQKHPNARIFGFGIGSSVNRYLLDEMSREGRGEVEYVNANDDGSKAARRFYERIRNPLLTDISLEIQGIQTDENFPAKIPDLFDAKPVSIVGRYLNGGNGKVILRGKTAGKDFLREISVKFPNKNDENDVLATLWARRKVADLSRQDYQGLQTGKMKDDLQQAIISLGLEFRLLTQFTSFVAVEEKTVTDGTEIKTVEVPVAVPFGQNGPDGSSFSIDGFQIGSVNQTVSVTSSNTALDTSDSKISTVVTQHQVLPLLTRGKGTQTIISIAGGISQINENQSQNQQGLVSSNGQRSTSNSFTVDNLSSNLGASADDTSISKNIGSLPTLTASNGLNSQLTRDSLEELTIRTIPAAKEGRVSGANINYGSKSGTNRFHGSVFETFGNEVLNANDFFANSRNLKRAPGRLNQFGGTLGGFIKKDKSFFFTNYEGLRIRQSAFGISEVPNLISRQTASVNLQPILNAFARPNGQNTANGFAEFAANFTNPAEHNIFGLRIDNNLTDRLRISGRYNFAGSDAVIRGGKDFSINTLRYNHTNTDSLSLWIPYTITPSIIAESRINFSRNKLAGQYKLDNFGGANVANLTSSKDFAKFDFAGKNSALAFGNQTETDINQFQAIGTVDWIYNNHSFTFGTDFRRLSYKIGANPTERNILFSGVSQSLTGTASRIYEISRISPENNPHANNFSFYAQDAWRIMSRFNVNLGLRWDADTTPKINEIILSSQNANSQMPDNYKNFAPRLSAAYDPFNSGKTVLRGGISLYYDFTNSQASEIFANSFPFAVGNFARNVNFYGFTKYCSKTAYRFQSKFKNTANVAGLYRVSKRIFWEKMFLQLLIQRLSGVNYF